MFKHTCVVFVLREDADEKEGRGRNLFLDIRTFFSGPEKKKSILGIPSHGSSSLVVVGKAEGSLAV